MEPQGHICRKSENNALVFIAYEQPQMIQREIETVSDNDETWENERK